MGFDPPDRPPNTDTIRCQRCNAERYVPGEGRTGLEICKPCKTSDSEALYLKLCPEEYQDTDPARLPLAQYEKAMQWKMNPKGLLLTGVTGKGKTRIVWKLIEKLIKENHLRGLQVFSSTGFGHELGKAYKNEVAEEWIESIWKAPLVVFDDLGKSKFTDRVETELFGVIDYRTSHKLPIIATTNDTGQSLSDRMSDNRAEPLIRRLREFCEVISF